MHSALISKMILYTLHYITLQCIAPSYPTDTGSTTWLLSIASPRPLLHCNHHHHPHNHHHHHHHQYHHHHHHGHTGSKWLISPQATNAPFWQHCEVLQKLFLVQMGAHLSQGAAQPTNDTDTVFYLRIDNLIAWCAKIYIKNVYFRKLEKLWFSYFLSHHWPSIHCLQKLLNIEYCISVKTLFNKQASGRINIQLTPIYYFSPKFVHQKIG